MRLLWPIRIGLLASGLLLMSASGSFAQSSGGGSIPVVTIEATVPIATWAGQDGVFTVWRSGDAAPALNVYYGISGTASNGVDYRAIGQWVQLPSGVTSNTIVIEPINRGQTNIETVTLEPVRLAADDAGQLLHWHAEQCDGLYRAAKADQPAASGEVSSARPMARFLHADQHRAGGRGG